MTEQTKTVQRRTQQIRKALINQENPLDINLTIVL